MKIQGPSSLKNHPSQSLKKNKTDGMFETLLETATSTPSNKASSGQHENRQEASQHRWQLLEEAASLLDNALEKLSDGKKPDEDTLDSIEQLRAQLHQHMGESNDELGQADAILATEAERIHTLNR